MTIIKEYADYDGLGLGQLVRRKEVSPSELVESAYAAIERLNPKLNAVITLLKEHANETLKLGPNKIVGIDISDISINKAIENSKILLSK